MIVEQHYDEEALIALLDGEGAQDAGTDPHLTVCKQCRDAMESYRDIVGSLDEQPVWDSKPLHADPVPKTMATLRAFSDGLRRGDAEAVQLINGLLAGPRVAWMTRLRGDAKYFNSGVARRLTVMVYDAGDRAPADALVMAELASAIVDRLERLGPANASIAKLHGDAAHARAHALQLVGDYRAATVAVSEAERAYANIPSGEFELARLSITRSSVLAALEQYPEATRELVAGGRIFVKYGDRRRLQTVRHAEALIAYRALDYRRALAIWLELVDALPVGDGEIAGIEMSVASAYREISDFDKALEWYRRASDGFAAVGATANLLRVRWSIGRVLLAQQHWDEAASVLRSVIFEFARERMREDVILAKLDLVEILVVREDHEQIAQLCHGIILDLRSSHLENTQPAMLAVSYLQEAVAARRASPATVTHVRDYVERVRTQPALLFAPPPY